MRFNIGEVIGVDVVVAGVPVHHVGVVVSPDYGWDTRVISNSKRRLGVIEESLRDFAEGASIRRHPHIRGRLHPFEVVRRARSRLGDPWDVVTSNCEHFVRWVHDLPEVSPQLGAGVAKAIVLGLGIAFVGAARSGTSGRRRRA